MLVFCCLKPPWVRERSSKETFPRAVSRSGSNRRQAIRLLLPSSSLQGVMYENLQLVRVRHPAQLSVFHEQVVEERRHKEIACEHFLLVDGYHLVDLRVRLLDERLHHEVLVTSEIPALRGVDILVQVVEGEILHQHPALFDNAQSGEGFIRRNVRVPMFILTFALSFEVWQTLRGPFSAVSKPIFATKIV